MFQGWTQGACMTQVLQPLHLIAVILAFFVHKSLFEEHLVSKLPCIDFGWEVMKRCDKQLTDIRHNIVSFSTFSHGFIHNSLCQGHCT